MVGHKFKSRSEIQASLDSTGLHLLRWPVQGNKHDQEDCSSDVHGVDLDAFRGNLLHGTCVCCCAPAAHLITKMNTDPKPGAIEALTRILEEFDEGPVHTDHPQFKQLEWHLIHAWEHFLGGDEEGMEGSKILNRLEDVTWTPPSTLTFWIERHGATMQGSTRADLHQWTVDVSARTARITRNRKRQLSSSKPRLDAKNAAELLVTKISAREDDDMLHWISSQRDEVRVLLGQIATSDGATAKETIQGRVKKLRHALALALEPHGWHPAKGKRNVYFLDPKKQNY